MQVSDEADALIAETRQLMTPCDLKSVRSQKRAVQREPYWSLSLSVGSRPVGMHRRLASREEPTVEHGSVVVASVIHGVARNSEISGEASWSWTMNRCPPS